MTIHTPVTPDNQVSLHIAMASAFGEIEAATKSANNPHFKSKYADLGAVIEAIKPALIKHGLFFTQHPHPSEEGVTVETVLHHASGESFSLGSLFLPANKRDAQGFGSALTYARRYGLVTAFGVPVEDDDGNAAVRAGQGQSKREVSPDQPKRGENWGGRYPTKTALWNACKSHHAELERLGTESTLDDLEGFLTSPEYADYVASATVHAPQLLDGPMPDMPEFIPTFKLEQKARDLIALRGNVPADPQDA